MPGKLLHLFQNRLRKSFFHLSTGAVDLIDITISMFVIMVLLLAVFSATATFKHIRRTNLDDVAAKIVSREIERLRGLDYSATPTVPSSYNLNSTTYPDLTKLPAGWTAPVQVSHFYPYDCVSPCSAYSTDKKKITVTISWVEKGNARSVSLDTIISKNGI